MSRWFRYYDEALDDPKVQRLDGDTFKAWVNLLCLASRNGGVLPAIEDIGFALRISANDARTLVERLLNATLIDRLSGGPNGSRYAPHGWDERQYKSDTSTDRVKRFRKRSKPVPETPPESDTETEETIANAMGAEAPPNDPVKELFDLGVSVLVEAGCTEKQARSLVGKHRKNKGDGECLTAFIECRSKHISDPVEWLEKRLAVARYVSKSGHEYRGSDEDILKEAERRGDNDTYWRVKGDINRRKKAAA